MTNHVDRFHAALKVLAGHGHVKQRLIRAYEDYLVDIREDEMPVELKQSFADLRHKMHSVTPLIGEAAIAATVRKMSLAEASECAASIVCLFGDVSRLRDDTQVSLPLMEGEGARIPPFLVKSV